MLLGTITAIIHGAALPAFTVVFGNFINIFIFQDITSSPSILNLTNGTAVNCSAEDPFMLFVDQTVDISVELNGELFVCPYLVNDTSNFTDLFLTCFGPQVECLSNPDFIGRVNILVYIFLGIAVGVFTMAYFEISFFQTACERQVKKIRLAFYKAIMRQEVGWFDANPSGELASRISE